MNWNPKEAIAYISGIVITSTLCHSKATPPSIANLAGGIVENAVKGITLAKEQTPEQRLSEIIKNSAKKALDEVRTIFPYELPPDCEYAIIDRMFSLDNTLHYLEADDKEALFEETITDIISSYCECSIETLPIKQITDSILYHMEAGIRTDWKTQILQNNVTSKETLREVKEIKTILAERKSRSHNKQKIRERSARRLQECQSAVRFSYYHQYIDPSIVPRIEVDHVTLSLSELLPWIEQQGINRIQLIGEGGMGKTSMLLSLWNHLMVNTQYDDYLVNMIKLNRINNMGKKEADRFLLTEFSKKFLFDDTYLTESQLNEALKILSEADDQDGKYKYVLLLDGFNEIQSDYQLSLMNQLNALESNQNIILILTSRFQLGPQQLAYDLYPFWVSDLGMDTILAYLNKHGKAFPENFHGLLQSPMMLTVYCETEPLSQANLNNRFFLFPKEIGKKQDLVKAFFEGIACKEYNANGDLEKLVHNLFVHNYVLPCIASHMEERFHISYQEVKNCIRIICEEARTDNPIMNAMFRERDLEECWAQIRKQANLEDMIRRYLLENPTVFVGNDSREEKLGWMFIHQEYRDYCKLTYDVTYLKKFLAEEGFPVKLTDSQLSSAIWKIRRKLQNYPNRHWKNELDNMSGQNIRPGQIATHDQIGATDIYVIMKALVHSGFRQIDEMKEVVNSGEADDFREKLRTKAAAFLELINVLDFKSMLIGTSDFKEKYLDALFRLENKNLPIRIFEIPRDKLDEVVRTLAQDIENAEKYVDFDIQLPTKKQMYEAACSNDYSTIYKIIVSCKGQYGWLYQILGVVLELYPLVHGKFQDYISMPKPNGYKALHATVDVGDGMPVTIMIRQTRKLRDPGSKVYLPPPVT